MEGHSWSFVGIEARLCLAPHREGQLPTSPALPPDASVQWGVILAKAGIQCRCDGQVGAALDPGIRRNDTRWGEIGQRSGPLVSEHFPVRWTHLTDKEMLQIQEFERVLIVRIVSIRTGHALAQLAMRGAGAQCAGRHALPVFIEARSVSRAVRKWPSTAARMDVRSRDLSALM